MTDFTWDVHGRNVVGTSAPANPTTGGLELAWGLDPESPSFPWPATNFPCLLILQVGFTLTLGGTPGVRRPILTLNQPNGHGQTRWPASTTATGTQTRRYEFAAGTSLDSPLSALRAREPLPEALVLLPGLEGQPNASFSLSVQNWRVGDSILIMSIHGELLLE